MLLPCSAHSLFIIPLQINGSLGSISIYPLNHCSWVVLISRISYKSLNIANIWTFISIDSLWTKCYMRPHLDNLLSRILRSTRIRRTWHRSSCSPPTVWSTCSQSEIDIDISLEMSRELTGCWYFSACLVCSSDMLNVPEHWNHLVATCFLFRSKLCSEMKSFFSRKVEWGADIDRFPAWLLWEWDGDPG